jgi:hypothetical protein
MGGMGCQICHDSPCTCSFMTSAVAGCYDDAPDEMDEVMLDAVSEWHSSVGESGVDNELHVYLGMTRDEYKRWVEDPKSLQAIIEERRRR